MNQSNNRERLKDKFSKVEISIDDERFIHKLDQASIEKMVVVKKERSKLLLSLFKLMKITSIAFTEYSKNKYKRSAQNIFACGKNISLKTMTFVRKREEQVELLLERKINKFEMVKRELKEYEDLARLKREALVEEFRSNASHSFLNYLDYKAFSISVKDYISLVPLFMYQMKIMDSISSKLIASNMIVNVKKISMSLHAEGDDVVSRIHFELDKKGHLWSIMFGKSIVPEINKLIIDRQGKVTIKQVCNTAISKDLFSVAIEYKLKEVSRVIPPPLTALEKIVSGDVVV